MINAFITDIGRAALWLAKLTLCMAVMLAPFAIEAAVDKWLKNTLPPTEGKEAQP